MLLTERLGWKASVRSSSSSKLSKEAGPLTKSLMCRERSVETPGEHHASDQLGRVGCQGHGGHPAERHADDGLGLGGELADGHGDVDGVVEGVDRRVLPGSRVSVARQVDGHQWAVEGQGHGVPGVGVLGTAVEEDELWWARSPDEGRERAAIFQGDLGPAHRGRPGPLDAVVLGVLVEHRELVVLHDHAAGPLRSSRALSLPPGAVPSRGNRIRVP